MIDSDWQGDLLQSHPSYAGGYGFPSCPKMHLVQEVDVGVEEGGRVEGWQADGREALGGLQEGLAGHHEVAQHQQVSLAEWHTGEIGSQTSGLAEYAEIAQHQQQVTLVSQTICKYYGWFLAERTVILYILYCIQCTLL